MIMSALDCEYLTIEYIEVNQDGIANDIEIYRKKYGVSITGTLPELKKRNKTLANQCPQCAQTLFKRALLYCFFM